MRFERRRILLLGLIVLIGVGGATTWWALRRPGSGPLDIPPHYGYSKPLKVGQSFTDAYNVLWLRAGTQGGAQILSVEPVWDSPKVTTKHVWAALPSRPGPELVPMASYLTARPNDARLGQLVDVRRAPIETEQHADLGTQILFSTTVRAAGHFLRTGYFVTYTVDGSTYRDFITAQITICTPAYLTADGRCPPLGEGAN